ncbi:MAG: hypothetical protein US52_C0005G0005 [candidate division WS6 bacterium GW2011_GWA2_37_6]|uniref:Uncharacterized protein n=1 Tax=candidate division WS6 bacterium GW2011_GWA2_37_6 TaxID=1619087 RepID=A0A0G0HCF2_9BACT|nr:MAG: hypothetical protein US52_C0005G0005 [candidate division WS6 bacterium GW2011_GWA2_37_6]
MPDQDPLVDFSGENNVDRESQFSLSDKDKSSHKSSKFNLAGIVGMVGVVFIVIAAIVAGLVLKDDVSTKDTSASAECGDFQVKVLTSDSYYCKECGTAEYGKLDICEEDSPSGNCEKVDSGCFKPVL